MRAIVLAIAIAIALAAPAPAHAFCFKEVSGVFHKPKAGPVSSPGPLVEVRGTDAPKAGDSFCKQVMRSAAVSMVASTLVVGLKVSLGIFTGILIF